MPSKWTYEESFRHYDVGVGLLYLVLQTVILDPTLKIKNFKGGPLSLLVESYDWTH